MILIFVIGELLEEPLHVFRLWIVVIELCRAAREAEENQLGQNKDQDYPTSHSSPP